MLQKFPPFFFYALLIALLAACAHPAYEEGRALAARGLWEEATPKLREATQADTRNTDYRLAYLGALERARVSLLSQAQQALAQAQFEEAKSYAQRVLQLDAENARARAILRESERDARHAAWLSELRAEWNASGHANANNGKTGGGKSLRPLSQDKLAQLLAENPNHIAALKFKNEIEGDAPKSARSAMLREAYKKPITIEFKDAALKSVFEVLSRTAGLNFVFDKDVRADLKTTIFLRNSTIEQAVASLLISNQLEERVLDDNTVLIYPATVAKQRDYQALSVRSFYLANADAKVVTAAIKSIAKSRDVVFDERLNLVIVRDTPDALKMVEKIVALHDLPEAEVMLEVEVLEVKRQRLMQLGVAWPGQLSLSPLVASGGTLTAAALKNLSHNSVAATISPLTINANNTDSDTNILANPRIRARNREKAKILIGDRVPNITTTATATGFISESINYVDVGLKLEVEPTVYLDGDVAIKIQLEVSNITSQIKTNSGSTAYNIGTRTASTVLRLKDGENQVLAGLISNEDRKSGNRVPGLGDLPIVGRLFGSESDDAIKTEIVLSITPRIVRKIERPEASLLEFESGTETGMGKRGVSVDPAQRSVENQANTAGSGAPALLNNANLTATSPNTVVNTVTNTVANTAANIGAGSSNTNALVPNIVPLVLPSNSSNTSSGVANGAATSITTVPAVQPRGTFEGPGTLGPNFAPGVLMAPIR